MSAETMLHPAILRIAIFTTGLLLALNAETQQLTNRNLAISIQNGGGSYQLATYGGTNQPLLSARVGAQIDGRWVFSSEYPQCRPAESAFSDSLGAGRQIAVTCSGLQEKPDLIYTIQTYELLPYATIQGEVRNNTGKTVTVQAIRSVEALGHPVIGLPGHESADRVLSDSYSEDWPRLVIYDLGKGPRQMHRAAWSQVVYNRETKQSLFVGALSADRFLTLIHLGYEGSDNPRITSYTVDSTGTTELQKEYDLRQAPAEDIVELSLPVEPGQSIASERVMLAAGPDYHQQLVAYGAAIRKLHQARVSSPNLIGWWSWTSYYMAINEGASLTNAEWLAENLKPLGYDYFHIDEGYQYARGEYATPNARLFPHGMRPIGDAVRHLGLTFGVWTAPFEVTNRAWVFEHHKDWLVHTADGQPIPIGRSYGDTLYALDTTHPGAQEYMTRTYTTLTQEWGVRYIKLDFMDTASIEGYHHRPNTTAIEAQRIGLEVIRKAVGDNVLLDKDGSPMLPPVGYVDTGRISADTSHTFQTTKAVAPGIAARFYMHRNYFIDDPDAFNVCAEVPIIRAARTGGRAGRAGAQVRPRGPLTLQEAEASIVLSAVSGGMYEIGDDLPTLGAEKDRLELVKNEDLLNMAKVSRAATPVDLLSYETEDEEPSIFFLKEDPRQSILAVFNWTDTPRSHTLNLTDLGLPANHRFQAWDVLNHGGKIDLEQGAVRLKDQEPHSVRVVKLIDGAVPAAAPEVTAQVPSAARMSEVLPYSAQPAPQGVPVLSYRWDFGDGTTAEGERVTHAYTRPAVYTVQLIAKGLDGIESRQRFSVQAAGTLTAAPDVLQNRRYADAPAH